MNKIYDIDSETEEHYYCKFCKGDNVLRYKKECVKCLSKNIFVSEDDQEDCVCKDCEHEYHVCLKTEMIYDIESGKNYYCRHCKGGTNILEKYKKKSESEDKNQCKVCESFNVACDVFGTELFCFICDTRMHKCNKTIRVGKSEFCKKCREEE